MRLMLVAAVPLLIAGCSTVDDPFLETGSIRPDAAPLSTEISPDFAAAYLPAVAGTVESVRQTVRDDNLEQAIVYTNETSLAGENVLSVRIGRPGGDDVTLLRPPTRRAVLAEMRQALPGIDMALDATPGENMHGVYGYATGSLGNGGSCLYAWQYAKRVSPHHDTAAARLTTTAYSAQVRLRYCHPSIPRERIASLMNGMRLKPVTRETFDVLRYAAGSGAYQRSAVRVSAEPVVQVREVAVDAEPRSTPRRSRTEEKPAEEPVVIRNAVRVPLPGEIAIDKMPVADNEDAAAREREVASKAEGKALIPLPGQSAGD